MSEEDRRLLALLAVFAPARAERLLSRLDPRAAGPVLLEGSRLAQSPRRARLLALEEAFTPTATTGSEWIEALASAERPPFAAALRAGRVAEGPGAPMDRLRPALRRLLGERRPRSPG